MTYIVFAWDLHDNGNPIDKIWYAGNSLEAANRTFDKLDNDYIRIIQVYPNSREVIRMVNKC